MILKYLIILLVLLPIKVLAVIEVDITRGNLNPLPVAISPLAIDKGDTATGRGLRFPLVISTSIRAKALMGSKINSIIKYLKIILSF